MSDGQSEREALVDEWRRAWFDGWTEGVIWTLAKERSVPCAKAVTPTSVGCGVIRHMARLMDSERG